MHSRSMDVQHEKADKSCSDIPPECMNGEEILMKNVHMYSEDHTDFKTVSQYLHSLKRFWFKLRVFLQDSWFW